MNAVADALRAVLIHDKPEITLPTSPSRRRSTP